VQTLKNEKSLALPISHFFYRICVCVSNVPLFSAKTAKYAARSKLIKTHGDLGENWNCCVRDRNGNPFVFHKRLEWKARHEVERPKSLILRT
jgi:hypothetical protein